jgi:hypothetical protein
MEPSSDKKLPDYLLKLIEGCSMYAKIATQFWIAIAFFSILTLSPSKASEEEIKLPFGLNPIKETDFYPFAFVIIAVLLIGFGSAICQSIRVRQLIQRSTRGLKDSLIFQQNIYLQDLVDAILYPALNRVAPLAQVLHGKNQFFPEAFKVSRFWRVISSTYYLLLKLIVTLILYVLPGYALIHAFFRSNINRSTLWNIPFYVFWVVGLFSLIILFQLLIMDIIYTINALKRINPVKKGFYG